MYNNSMLRPPMLVPLTNEELLQYQAIESNQEINQDCSFNILQLVGTDMPPIRNRVSSSYSVPNGVNNMTQQCYSQALVSPQIPNYQKSPSNRGYMKRNHYYHNMNKNKDMRYCRLRPQDLDSSNDSGIDSQCSTPGTPGVIHPACDQEHTDEFSDETLHGDLKGVKRVHEMNGGGQVSPFYYHNIHNCQQTNQNHGIYYARRNENPHQGYKRRYHNVGERHFMPNYGAPMRGRRITGMFISPPESSTPIMFSHHPDRFLTRAHMEEVKQPPVPLTTGSEWDDLSSSIWIKFVAQHQSADMFLKKMQLWKSIFTFIKSLFQSQLPRYSLYVVGSTMSGFGSNSSDVDMCLVVRATEIDQRNEALSHLSYIQRLLLRWDFVGNLELIQAKVPILKFRDLNQGLEVDLNCNNSVGIRNTHLLYCYSKLDWRVRPLVLTVKLWAHANNINDAKNMTISSYSLALMVIHFLQCGVTPPVLPCLHKLYTEKFTPDSDIQQIDIHEELPAPASDNKQSLGELFYDFFTYYNNFNFSRDAISVRLGTRIRIEECRRAQTLKNEPHQWKYLCIEEPFDQTNTARSVYDPGVFEHIRFVFKVSHKHLKDTLCLDSIFNAQTFVMKTR